MFRFFIPSMKRINLKLTLFFCTCLILLCGCAPVGEYVYEYTGIDWLIDTDCVITDESEYYPVQGYGYTTLSANEQRLYKDMADAANTYRSFVKVDFGCTVQRAKQLYYCFTADFPQLFWVDGYSYSSFGDRVTGIYLNYSFDKEESESLWNEMEQELIACDQALSLLKSDFDKSVWINDYLCNKVAYTSDHDNRYIAYGALIDGKAVCAGYAKAAQLLFYSQDMTCLYVRGFSQNERHGWNIVQLDGDYYHLDVTWNDAIRKNDGPNTHFYTYQHISDEIIAGDHEIYPDENCPLPACDSMEQNYFYQKDLRFTSQKTLPEKVAAEAVTSFRQDDYIVDFMVGEQVDVEAFIDEGMSRVYRTIRNKMGYVPVSYTYSYSRNEEIGTVRLYFTPK